MLEDLKWFYPETKEALHKQTDLPKIEEYKERSRQTVRLVY